MEKGYYWVKHYNYKKVMPMYWNGDQFEKFKSDPAPHDEIDFSSVVPFSPPNKAVEPVGVKYDRK